VGEPHPDPVRRVGKGSGAQEKGAVPPNLGSDTGSLRNAVPSVARAFSPRVLMQGTSVSAGDRLDYRSFSILLQDAHT
jgi:hypothetical protein